MRERFFVCEMAMKKARKIFVLGVAVLLCGCVSVEEIGQEADTGNIEMQYKIEMQKKIGETAYFQVISFGMSC